MLERTCDVSSTCHVFYTVSSSEEIYQDLTGLVDPKTEKGEIWFDPGQPYAEITFTMPTDPRGEKIPTDLISISILPSEAAKNFDKCAESDDENSGENSINLYKLGNITQCDIVIINDIRWSSVEFGIDQIKIRQTEKMLQIPVIRDKRLDHRVRVHWAVKAADDSGIYSSMKGVLTIDVDSSNTFIPIELFPRPVNSESNIFKVILGPGISDEAYLEGNPVCDVEVLNDIGKFYLEQLESSILSHRP